jgi:hypothetical protein
MFEYVTMETYLLFYKEPPILYVLTYTWFKSTRMNRTLYNHTLK